MESGKSNLLQFYSFAFLPEQLFQVQQKDCNKFFCPLIYTVFIMSTYAWLFSHFLVKGLLFGS